MIILADSFIGIDYTHFDLFIENEWTMSNWSEHVSPLTNYHKKAVWTGKTTPLCSLIEARMSPCWIDQLTNCVTKGAGFT